MFEKKKERKKENDSSSCVGSFRPKTVVSTLHKLGLGEKKEIKINK